MVEGTGQQQACRVPDPTSGSSLDGGVHSRGMVCRDVNPSTDRFGSCSRSIGDADVDRVHDVH